MLHALGLHRCLHVISSGNLLLQVDWMVLIELLIDMFFLADIALNFNTGYISEQVTVLTILFSMAFHLWDVD